MKEPKLMMLLLGCRPAGRNTEQHDIFFGIASTLKDLIPAIKKSWPEAKGNIHIDAWREVDFVYDYRVKVECFDAEKKSAENPHQLFFINLGGYKENEFDEFHYKMLVVAENIEAAKAKAKKTAFFKHHSVKKTDATPNATAHVDDKYGIDIDEAFKVEDILPDEFKSIYRVVIAPSADNNQQDVLNLGYFKLSDL